MKKLLAFLGIVSCFCIVQMNALHAAPHKTRIKKSWDAKSDNDLHLHIHHHGLIVVGKPVNELLAQLKVQNAQGSMIVLGDIIARLKAAEEKEAAAASREVIARAVDQFVRIEDALKKADFEAARALLAQISAKDPKKSKVKKNRL